MHEQLKALPDFSDTRNGPLIPVVGVVALVPDDWGPLWQPRHYVLSKLACYFHVVWVTPAPEWRFVLRNRESPNCNGFEEGLPPGMAVYSPEPWFPKFNRPEWLAKFTFDARIRRARRILLRRGCQKIVLYVWRPEFRAALDSIPFDLSCYHIDDEYSFSQVEAPPDPMELELMSRVDRVFIHSPGLWERKGDINPNTTFAPNGVDYAAYSKPVPDPADLSSIPHPRIGYTGWIKRQLNWPLLVRLTQAHPEWSFVFVGPQSPHAEILSIIDRLSQQRNVHFLGAKSVPELSAYPQHFDVCIMPYDQNDDSAKYIYPLKLHEYLASGSPVVGTRIRSLESFSQVVSLVETPEEWSAAIARELEPAAASAERRAIRQATAKEHDWTTLVDGIARTMAGHFGPDVVCQLEESIQSAPNVAAIADGTNRQLNLGPDADKDMLDSALVHSIAWTSGVMWAAQLVSWVSTVFTARLLEPSDYGVISIAMAYLGLLTLVNEFGLGTTVVTLRKLDREHVSQINTLAVLIGIICFAVSYLMADPLAVFFRDPRLGWVVFVMSISFLISAFKSVPSSLLEKELRFKSLALIEGSQILVQSLCTLAFAFSGLAYWALALGWLVGTAWSTSLVLLMRRSGFARLRLSSLREVFSFSRNVSIGRISWYVYTNADFIVAGKLLGGAALGAYTFAWSLANIATNKVTAQVGKVTPAFFSAVQHDNAALSRYLLIITEGLAMITTPVTLGLFLIADDFVLLVLGNQWRPVITPLRLLLIYTACRAMMTLPPQILNVKGKSQFVMFNNLIGAVLLPLMFYAGSFWGTVGIASAWLVWFPLIALPVYWQVFRAIKLSPLAYIKALRPAVTVSAAMALFMSIVKFMVESNDPLQERLILSVIAGVGSYSAALFLFYREKVKNCLEVFRMLYAGARSPSSKL